MAESVSQDFDRSGTSRKVFVENTSKWDYSEEFRGRMIIVPANGKIVMQILEAERFLGRSKPPAQYTVHGDLAPGSPPPKALKIVEFTPEEVKKIEGKSLDDVKKEKAEAEKKAAFGCAICPASFGSEKGLRMHVTRVHPEYEPVSSE